MDYKEKYEAMVKRCRELHKYGDSLTKQQMEIVYPQLKESDDEKIRKEILEYFNQFENGELRGVDITSWIAYLERQKEYVSDNFDDVWTTEDCTEIIEAGEKLSPRFKELFKEVCHAWYDKGIELEKQKEQKPSEKSSMLKKLREHLANTPKEQLDAEFEALKHLTIDKPAGWSEEDEKIFNSLCTVLHGGLSSIPTEKFISWLKSRLSQPKQEWSDKDKEMFDRCIANAKKHIPIPDKNGHLAKIEEIVDEELVDWLKGRFFNVHWKPSMEQMEALWGVTEKYLKSDNEKIREIIGKVLESLYNDIKKLM